MKYKHYSFDLWGTLIKGNPEFKKRRVDWFMKEYGISSSYVRDAIGGVDVMCNYVNEVCGGNITSEEMYAMVLHKLDIRVDSFDASWLSQIYSQMETLFLEYPPTIIDGVVETLTSLRERGCTLSILSNTGFITGWTVRKFLDTTPLKDMFTFQIYSDYIKHSKPFHMAFYAVKSELVKHGMRIDDRTILHVGDNPLADVKGANGIGIDALLINNSLTDKTIKDVLTYNALPSILG